ncbi:MAG: exonuclease SbcCD subunit D [Bacilli bacterium]|nr:exonuclease SbcCD subunit D [Bacilli bacterium]
MHLSDLHLGRSILEQSLIDDQEYILDQLLKIVKENEVDVVLICGDVYDKSIPSVDAVNLFSNFLSSLYKINVKVCVISGNHDSKDRLSFGNELFVDNDVYIEGIFNGKLRCVSFNDNYGKINIYMLPFVKPVDVRKYFQDVEIDSYDEAVSYVINNTNIDYSERNIIMIHQFVTGSNIEIERSDSEIISLGGIDNVDANIFNKFDYVAIGHVHRPQRLLKDTVRYAGSPLKYSFSEANHNKSVPIIDFKDKNDIDIELIDLFPKRDLRIIKGPIDKLLDKEVYKGTNLDDYICAVIIDNDYVIDAIGKLRKVYKNILKIEYVNDRNNILNDVSGNVSSISKDMTPIQLFEKFYKEMNNIELDQNRKIIVADVVKEVMDEAN